MENIIISNPAELEKTKKAITAGGADKLHILTDFDRTLTRAFVNGESTPSLISTLRNGNYLASDYAAKAHAFYAKYHLIEIDPKVSEEEKKAAMHEWWTRHFDLLIRSGFNKKDLEEVIGSNKVCFRPGTVDLIDLLNARNIPLVVMSSSGLGGDGIAMYFAKADKLNDNVHIISNAFEWDEEGNAISVKEPIIHLMNKDETAIQNFPVFDLIKDKKNVLLLGDSLGDIGMIKGFDHDFLIKIGFLNENIEENLEGYKKAYDILILRDSSMDYVNTLLKEMIF